MEGHDSEDPKQSTADMTAFVQHLLQQMQSRFQTMSDSIVSKNILTIVFTSLIWRGGNLTWDDLEKSIDELREEMGVEGSPSPLAPSKFKTEEGSA